MSPSDPRRPPRRSATVDRPDAVGTPAASEDEVGTPAVPESEQDGASSPPSREKASGEARIAKVMARAGLCSRRDAEAWVLAGRVAVNGATIDSPALNVGPGDAVTVDGYPIDKPERTRLFLFHKTRGLVTTAKDPEGRPTVFDALPPEMPRVVTIGRLDINTEGLLLLTNDGGLARMLELPATGWIRRYRVRANGTTDQARLDALAKGITIDGVAYAGIAAKLDRVQGANLWLTMGLKEGKNREIKRVLEHLGLAVTRLIRISFGPFQLGELGDNAVEEVRTRVLRDQLGSALAKQAGLDFDGPVDEGRVADPPPPAREGGRAPRGGFARGTPAPPEEPRRQTRRTQTADRRGRPVTVERITASERPAEGARVAPRRSREGAETPTRSARPAPAPRRPEGSHPKEERHARSRTPGSRSREDGRAGGDRPRAAAKAGPPLGPRGPKGEGGAPGRSRTAGAPAGRSGASGRPHADGQRNGPGGGQRPRPGGGAGGPRRPPRRG